MRILQRLLISIVCLAPSLAAQSWHVSPARLSGVAQDSTGQVWAIGYAPSLGLYRWGSDKWSLLAVDGLLGNAQPMAIARGSDGAVYGVWSAGMDTHPVTRHQGNSSKVVGQFTGSLAISPSIFVDPRGNVWITEAGPHIYRVTPKGKGECIYTIPDDEYFSFGPPGHPHPMFNPVYATADALGRIWFWSGGMPVRSNMISLQGVLIYDGENFKFHRHIVSMADEKLSVVEPDDPEHMWMAIVEDQIYRVDTKSLAPTAVLGPERGAFRRVPRIFHIGPETYVVSSTAGMPVPERSGEGRFGVLWRLRNGEWKRVVNGLDMRPDHVQDAIRPVVSTPEGVWVGAYGTGPWFIPAGPGEPVHIDWHYNYPFDESEGLFLLPDGRMLLVASNQGSIAVKPGELLAAFQAPSEIHTLNPVCAFIQDQRSHLWGILSPGDKALSEWDGKSWTPHALPDYFSSGPRYSFASDSQDQIWLVADPCRGPVTILNTLHGKFETYPDLPAALQAQLPNRPKVHIDGDFRTAPMYTPDGRIGYRDRCLQIHYFDGQRWQSWRRQEVDRSSRPYLDGPAFFDRAGNFAVDIEGTTWEYLVQGGWHSTSFEPGPTDDRNLQSPQPLPPPPGCEFGSPESIAQDRVGTYWMTYRGQFYHAITGLCLPQSSTEAHQPFIDGRTVKAVFIDPQGNAFLETYLHSNQNIGEYVIVNARQPLPQTRLHASVDNVGAVKLDFESTVKGKAWFTWRADNDVWAPPAQVGEATLTGLADGKHRIEARAIDERLRIDPTPAVVEVEIHADNQNQIAALIEHLKDQDYSVRDAAVAGLVRQPALALPLLQSAREKAGPDERWWIDAALQQIKERLGASPKP